jgi:2'-5' RNA ligase
VPSTNALTQLSAGLTPLQRAYPQARWTALEDVHLTLIFMAAVPALLVASVVSAVASVAADEKPFSLGVRGAGRFGGRGRARVSWLGIGEGAAHLAVLETILRTRLAAISGLEGLADDALSVPHLTVARRAPDGLATALRDAFSMGGPTWTVERIVLFRTDLSRDGARHEQIVSAPLGRSWAASAAGG